MRDVLLISGVFLACVVEAVEALTIVLAVGTTRSWRSTWYGVASALAVLALFVGLFGAALTAIPINVLRIVVGGLLLIFGLQWMRKAILRSSGFKSLHDEGKIFTKQLAQARSVKNEKKIGVIDDWYSFTVAFKGVLLEGLEVAFIIVTFGANQGSIFLAIIGAVAAIVLVVVAGIAVRHPLSKVPENTLKFIVGMMLTSFGTFWGAEGVGVHWPGSDSALLGIILFIAISSLVLVEWLKRLKVSQGKAIGKLA
jgi:uncharacterized membrane protein